ncbi:uncharacterized protein Dwil_GK21406 [Drosophila willistoni]|nr:coiled-coil and C2 domain-containing protein 2A [Drosophila willistoni]EDW74405.2 uncharacterized protein Dwil_GK21406 [Drosophila willistoni]
MGSLLLATLVKKSKQNGFEFNLCIQVAFNRKMDKKKNRKIQTSRRYRRTEQEVQALLRDTQSLSGGEEMSNELRSLQFFHGQTTDNEKGSGRVEEEELEHVPESDAESEEDSGGDLASNSKYSGSPSRHTFIQIDFNDPPLVWPKLVKQEHYYDYSLLYKPSSVLNFQLNMSDQHATTKGLTGFQKRLINRFQEQSKKNGSRLSPDLLAQLADANSAEFVIDHTLYRSYCKKEFSSIFFTPLPMDQVQGLPIRRFFKLTFRHLRFTCHPHFLDEHYLAQQLEDLFDLYAQQQKQQIRQKLRQELELARQVAAKLLQNAREAQSSEIKRQLRLIQQLRERYYAESSSQRKLLKRLLKNWAKLKELRRQQKFQCTRFQLSLRVSKPQDLVTCYATWKQNFETDLAEVYREHLELFYCRRRLWSEDNPSGSQSQLKPPRKPNFDKIMANLKREYECAFNDPEEPHIDIIRLYADESQMRISLPGDVKSRNYFMKLYLDGQYVGHTKSYRLEPDLHLYMNECIGVLLERTLPEELNIWLYEKSTLTPQSRRVALMSTTLELSSKCNADIIHKKLTFKETSSTSGDLFVHYEYRSAQAINSFGQLDDIRKLPAALQRKLMANSLPSLKELSQSDTQTAPRPPFRGKSKKKTLSSALSLIFAEQQLQFCSMATLLGNRRFQILHSRHQQRNFHTKQLRFVPSFEHEMTELDLIPTDGTSEPALLEPGYCWNPIDLHKHRGRKFLQLLYEVIRSQSARRARAMETPLPLLLLANGEVNHSTGWTGLWRALLSWFTAGGEKGITREPANWQPAATPNEYQQFTISLHVVRASGVPVRSRHILNVERLPTGGGDISANLFVTQTLMYSNVRPFITLSYGQRLSRSRTAEGSNPTWNEQLQLQLNGHVSDLREDIKISLFDELVEQQFTDEASDLYQRVQCNWLGEYRVPINCLLATGKFEGCIEMTMPKILVGYKRPLIDSVTNIASDQYPEFKESVHLWFYLSIEPNGCDLAPMQVNALACAELPELQSFLQERRLDVQQMLPQPQRYVDPLICTAQGKRVCLTRLLEPVPLPPSLNLSVESCARFVSLLSHFRPYDGCQRFQGVWLDNQSLLDSTWCSPKDLGVLLCNYMLSLGLQCWLLLGVACPYGECSFVLFRQPDTADLLLLAPATGKRYQLYDVYCPLMRVYCLVSQQNIYFNIQTEMRVSMTNFNPHDSSCWLPLFNRRQPTAPQAGIQKLDYVYKKTYDLSQLQKRIERKIMKKISAWRATRKTIWNRAFQPHLQKILRELENLSNFSTSRYDEPAYSEELEREYPNFRLYGFTLNFSYTNLAAITERIRTTCIHYNNNTVEFCVAVHINAYANDVLSVWLFLLSIVPLVE